MERYYVPILKWKKGEQVALTNLRNDQKSTIIPLIELVENDEPSTVIESISDCYEYPVFVDTQYVDDDRTYLKSLIRESQVHNVKVYPVLYFEDFPELAEELYDSVDRIAVKIPVPEDIDGESYSTILNGLLRWKRNKNIHLDVILDLHYIPDKKSANIVHSELKSLINDHLLHNECIQNIIVSLTSFPDDLSQIPSGGDIFVDRFDIKIFDKIIQNPVFSVLKDRLMYSDYGVTRFTASEIDFSRLRHGVLPKARYTIPEKYWVLKGKKDQQTKKLSVNHQTLAKKIFASDDYYGETFSFGDKEIKEIGTEADGRGPGGNTAWVTIATNHHISVLIEELSKYYES